MMNDNQHDKMVDETTDCGPVYEDFSEYDLICECYAKDRKIDHLVWQIRNQQHVIKAYMEEIAALQQQLTEEEGWSPYG